jgi:predicted restriction endonuclease
MLLRFTKRFLQTRPEQYKLRKFLLDNSDPICIFCQKEFPKYVLECAHIKPRFLSSQKERHDFNNINWMCRNCHKIYDYGHISIDLGGELVVNDEIINFDLDFQLRKNEYLKSKDYFTFHYYNIFKK